MNLDNILVFNFASGERTKDLSNYCFEKLGFKNIVTIESNTGFSEKFKECASLAVKSRFDTFIRSDSDRLVFDGILDILEKFYSEKSDCVEGDGHEFFMNRFRGATPHIFSKKVFEILHSDNSLMPNVQKPESFFINTLVNRKMIKEKTYKILTNLHEYEQYPSKVCNSFLNRITRGHMHYYDKNYLNTLHQYQESIEHAKSLKNYLNKSSMDHKDFSFLDEGFESISSEKDVLESYYQKYYQKYCEIKLSYRR